MAERKSSLGRQKIALKKISKKNHLQVTFSKRRAGLFKKASELCTLCGVEIAIIVFSPADKAFTFGHLDVDSVVDRFLTRNQLPTSCAQELVEAHKKANVLELNIRLSQVLSQLESERKLGETLSQMRKASQSECWWESPIEELGFNQLEQLRYALEELKSNITKHAANQIFFASTNGSSFLGASNGDGIGHVGSFEDTPINIKVPINPPLNNFGYGHGSF